MPQAQLPAMQPCLPLLNARARRAAHNSSYRLLDGSCPSYNLGRAGRLSRHAESEQPQGIKMMHMPTMRSNSGAGMCHRVGRLMALVTTMLVTGCAVEVQNTRPAQELARLSRSPGSVYLGWRVYQDKCATCHGPTANGGPGAPDLLPIVRVMGLRQFVSLVLTRYDWGPVAPGTHGDRAGRDALVDSMLQGKEEPLTMPAWGSEPRVSAHVMDLHAFLAARAQGLQGPERPTP